MMVGIVGENAIFVIHEGKLELAADAGPARRLVEAAAPAAPPGGR